MTCPGAHRPSWSKCWRSPTSLNNAGERSLVILDEVGRGTSTYDGLALAWAIVEHLHNKAMSRTLFATHYHQLTELADSLKGVHNLNIAVREKGEDIVFLHKIIPGWYGSQLRHPGGPSGRCPQALDRPGQGDPRRTGSASKCPRGDSTHPNGPFAIGALRRAAGRTPGGRHRCPHSVDGLGPMHTFGLPYCGLRTYRIRSWARSRARSTSKTRAFRPAKRALQPGIKCPAGAKQKPDEKVPEIPPKYL